MDLLWLYQISTVWLGILIVGGFVAASLLGLWLTRPLARRILPEQNDFANRGMNVELPAHLTRRFSYQRPSRSIHSFQD